MSVWLQEHTWPEIATYLEDKRTVLVPIGSTEQHGPHLPTGTDAMEAISVAEGVAEELDLLVTPPIWYGDARHHLAYPGTLALRPRTVIALLEDLYDSLAHHGFERVVTVNGHRRANVAVIENAMTTAAEDHPDIEFALADLVQVAVSAHKELMDGHPEDGTHGGEFETSFMLAEYPELVRTDAMEPNTGRPFSDSVTRSSIDKHDTLKTASSWQASAERKAEGHPGHRGDPTLASAEKGEKLRAAMIARIVEFIEDAQAQPADGANA
ncbi:MAG: creatininase family protein [Salinirussus sp.]